MSISVKTRKVLWGRAGARCSFEGCRSELISISDFDVDGSILGEEAHIISQSEDGPRGENLIESSRINLYDNLILLCPNHHKLVDKQPSKYTVDVLHEMKKAHESWVDHNLRIGRRNAEFHFIPDPAYSELCENRVVHVWKFPKVAILCCSFGSDPVEILSGIWKASGLEFKRFPNAKMSGPPECLLTVFESEQGVEYRCDADALEVTYFTFDPRISGFAPFVTKRFEHENPKDKVVLYLRLSPEIAPIEPVLDYLSSPRSSSNMKIIEENLYHMRNIGLSTPRQALKWTQDLRKTKFYDGYLGEILQDIEAEFQIVIDAESV